MYTLIPLSTAVSLIVVVSSLFFRDLEDYIDHTLPLVDSSFSIPVNEFDGKIIEITLLLETHSTAADGQMRINE